MKTIGLGILFVVFVALGALVVKATKPIKADKVVLGMTMEEVHGLLGEPIAGSEDRHGAQTWVYADREVKFSRGYQVIDVGPANAENVAAARDAVVAAAAPNGAAVSAVGPAPAEGQPSKAKDGQRRMFVVTKLPSGGRGPAPTATPGASQNLQR